jgi:hypothetical protein
MTQVKPILPGDVQDKKNVSFPNAIIEATNQLIVKEWNGDESHILQKDIVKRAIEIDSSLSSDVIYKNKWMDIEPIFLEAGWTVYYDKPGYNESYSPSFKFSKSK